MYISFSDFWSGFNNNNNFFVDLLKDVFPNINIKIIPLSEKTDFLFYSCFGNENMSAMRNKTKKIFYTGENKRPNFSECDYSLSFDFENYNGKNFRLPLWMLQIDWYNRKGYNNPQFILPLNEINKNNFTETPKNEFCCTVFNNNTHYRFETYYKLSLYKKVNGYGTPFNNWFYGENIKYNILSKHKFNICFENSIHPGYYTEKLFHAKTAGSVPIYWADKQSSTDFNEKSFINLFDFDNNVDKLIEYVIEVDKNENVYKSYINEPLFKQQPNLEGVKTFIKNIL